MKTVQYFTDEYLERCKDMSPKDILQFLEDHKNMLGRVRSPSKLISIKIPENLLTSFRVKADLLGIPYQTQIKILMQEWLK